MSIGMSFFNLKNIVENQSMKPKCEIVFCNSETSQLFGRSCILFYIYKNHNLPWNLPS